MMIIVENAYLLIEIITPLILLWALHGSKKKPEIYCIIYICISLIIENAISLNLISANFIIILHMGLIFLNILEFRDSIKNAILYTFIDIVIIFIIQYVFGMLFILMFHVYVLDSYKLMVLQMLFLIIVFLLCLKVNFQKVCKTLFSNNIISFILLIILGIICVAYITQLHLWKILKWENFILIAVIFVVFMVLMFEWQRENYINKQKLAELELFHEYNMIYQDFILDMRKKQHDFDNHLQAIFSMNMTAKNLDDLIKEQNNYCKELLENNQDSIFLKEDVNSVYLAFLYTKKKNAEALGIDVQYQFDCRDIESHLAFMDFITIVGNLFDNATEAVQNEDQKIIILEILQQDNSVLIHVFNTYSYTDGEVPADFFRGKSKKGDGHGLGLSNVTDIVKRYHGIMETTFDFIEQEKFYKLSLQLFWK